MAASVERRDQRTVWAAISVLLAVATLASVLMSQRARQVATVDASVRARNIAQQQISPLLFPQDAQAPVGTDRYHDLFISVGGVLAGSPVQSVRIWRTDGMVVFASDRSLVGRRFTSMSEHLRAVAEGGVLSKAVGASLQTFVPISIPGATGSTVVVQLDQSYAPVGSAGEHPWRWITFGFGLLLLLSIAVLLLTFRPVRPPKVVIADSRTWTPKDPKEDEMMAARAAEQEPADARARAASSDDPVYVHPGYRAEAEARERAEGRAQALEENYRVAQAELKKALDRLRDMEAAGSGAKTPEPGNAEDLRRARNGLREAEERLRKGETERHVLLNKIEALTAASAARVEGEEDVAALVSERAEAAEAELAQNKHRLSELEEETAQAAARLADADEQRAQASERAQAAEDQLDRVQGELAQAQHALERSEQWGKAAEVELQRASDSVAQMDERVRTAEQRLEEAHDKARADESQLEAVEVELKSADERMREMAASAAAGADEREAFLAQVAALNEQLQIAVLRASEAEAGLEELSARPAPEDLSAAEQLAAGVQQELDGTRDRVRQLEEELTAAKQRARDSDEELARMQSRLDESDAAADRLAAEIESVRAAQSAEPDQHASDVDEVLRITQERLAGSTEHLLQAEERARLAEIEAERLESALAETEEKLRLLQASPHLDLSVNGSGEADAQGEGDPKNTEPPATAAEDRRASGPFLAALSLEARNSLASILGIALTLKHKTPTKDQAPLIRQLATHTRRLDHMVGDLLDADRLARGSAELKRRRTDLDALIRRVLDDSGIPKERHVEVHSEKVVAPVDPIRVEQILSSLLQMCFNRTSSGAHLWVRLWPTEQGAVLAVEDELAANDVNLSPVITTFAAMHGGWAKVAERPGGGSSFRVFLPETPGDGPSPALVIDQEEILVAPDSLGAKEVAGNGNGHLPTEGGDPELLLRELGIVGRDS